MTSMTTDGRGDYGSIEHQHNSTPRNGKSLSDLLPTRSHTKMADNDQESLTISQDPWKMQHDMKRQARNTREVTMSWSNVTVEVIEQGHSPFLFRSKTDLSTSCRVLLKEISGMVRPSEILAVMGTSGAGKTTLLNALSGYSNSRELNVTGRVTLNRHVASSKERRSSNIIGYVEQQEPFPDTITVEEYLLFQAMLRIPSLTLTDDDRRACVSDTIKLLSMERCASTTISKLSGGERKRLAFATVALTDSPIMLIDEPTSNLDSYLAKSLMHTIRMLAVERRRSIVVVLHQPTADMFKFVDSLCVLADGGRQAFFGDAHREASRFFTDDCGLKASSLDGFIEQISSDSTVGQQVVDRFRVSSVASANPFMESISEKSMENSRIVIVGFWRQLKWLLWYSCVGAARSPFRTSKLALRLLVMGFIFGAAYFQLKPSEKYYVQNLNAIPFIIGMSLVVSNMTIIAVSTLNERARLIRDVQRGIYSIKAYYVAKFITDSIFVIIVSVLYTTIIVLLINMKELALMMLVISMEALAGCATVSLMTTISSSILIILLLLHPFNIILNQFTGVFINLRSIPSYFKWLQYLSYYYYGYSSMLILQWRDVTTVQQPCQSIGILINDTVTTPSTICHLSGTDVLAEYGVNQHDLYFNLLMLLVLILGYHMASFIFTFIRIRRTLS